MGQNKGLIIAPGLDSYLVTHSLNSEQPTHVAFIVTEKSIELLPKILSQITYQPQEVRKFFVKDTISFVETIQEFFNALYWLTETVHIRDVVVDATDVLTSMAFPLYFGASFIEVFKDLIHEDVDVRLILTNCDWVSSHADSHLYGAPIIGTEYSVELERPINGIGFILAVLANDLFNEGYYPRAQRVLEILGQRMSGEQHLLYEQLAQAAQGYDAWDKFSINSALSLLQGVRDRLHHTRTLYASSVLERDIEKSIICLEQLVAGDSLEHIVDIFENAERRFVQGRYDDAVARYYRCLEMMGQYALSAYEISTQSPDFSALPSDVVAKYEKARGGELPLVYRYGLALWDIFLLLFCIGDPLGKVYKEKESQFIGMSALRNQSLLAHGTKPIFQDQAEKFRDMIVLPFLTALLDKEGRDIQEMRARHQFPFFSTNVKQLFLTYSMMNHPETGSHDQKNNPRSFWEVDIREVISSIHPSDADRTAYRATRPDGSELDLASDDIVVSLRDFSGMTVEVTARSFEHIFSRHVRAQEAGGVFIADSLEEIFRLVARYVPEHLDFENKQSIALEIETEAVVGTEGVISVQELLNQGVVSDEDVTVLNLSQEEVFLLNRSGDLDQKKNFVRKFNQEFESRNVRLGLRAEAIVPFYKTPRPQTKKIFMALGKDQDESGNEHIRMYTIAPGRAMEKLPNDESFIGVSALLEKQERGEELTQEATALIAEQQKSQECWWSHGFIE